MDLILLTVYLLTNICSSIRGMTPKTIIISSETSRWIHQASVPSDGPDSSTPILPSSPYVIETTATGTPPSRTQSPPSLIPSTSFQHIVPSKSSTYVPSSSEPSSGDVTSKYETDNSSSKYANADSTSKFRNDVSSKYATGDSTNSYASHNAISAYTSTDSLSDYAKGLSSSSERNDLTQIQGDSSRHREHLTTHVTSSHFTEQTLLGLESSGISMESAGKIYHQITDIDNTFLTTDSSQDNENVMSTDRSAEPSAPSISGFELLMASNFSNSEIANWFEVDGATSGHKQTSEDVRSSSKYSRVSSTQPSRHDVSTSEASSLTSSIQPSLTVTNPKETASDISDEYIRRKEAYSLDVSKLMSLLESLTYQTSKSRSADKLSQTIGSDDLPWETNIYPITSSVEEKTSALYSVTSDNHMVSVSSSMSDENEFSVSSTLSNEPVLSVSSSTSQNHVLTVPSSTSDDHVLSVSSSTSDDHVLSVSFSTSDDHVLTVSSSTSDDHVLSVSSSTSDNHVLSVSSSTSDDHVLSVSSTSDDHVLSVSSSTSDDHVLSVSSTSDDHVLSVSFSTSDDHVLTVSSSTSDDRVLSVPSSTSDDHVLSVPSSTSDDHVLTVSSSTSDDHVLSVSSSTSDDHVLSVSSSTSDDHVLFVSSSTSDDHVFTVPSSTSDDHVLYLSSSTSDDHVLSVSSSTSDDHVLSVSSSTSDDHVLSVSSSTSDDHVLSVSSSTSDDHVLSVPSSTSDDHVLYTSSSTSDDHVLTVSSSTSDDHVLSVSSTSDDHVLSVSSTTSDDHVLPVSSSTSDKHVLSVSSTSDDHVLSVPSTSDEHVLSVSSSISDEHVLSVSSTLSDDPVLPVTYSTSDDHVHSVSSSTSDDNVLSVSSSTSDDNVLSVSSSTSDDNVLSVSSSISDDHVLSVSSSISDDHVLHVSPSILDDNLASTLFPSMSSSSSSEKRHMEQTTLLHPTVTTDTTYRILTIPELFKLNKITMSSSESSSDITESSETALGSSTVDGTGAMDILLTNSVVEERSEGVYWNGLSSEMSPSPSYAGYSQHPQTSLSSQSSSRFEPYLQLPSISINVKKSPNKKISGISTSQEPSSITNPSIISLSSDYSEESDAMSFEILDTQEEFPNKDTSATINTKPPLTSSTEEGAFIITSYTFNLGESSQDSTESFPVLDASRSESDFEIIDSDIFDDSPWTTRNSEKDIHPTSEYSIPTSTTFKTDVLSRSHSTHVHDLDMAFIEAGWGTDEDRPSSSIEDGEASTLKNLMDMLDDVTRSTSSSMVQESDEGYLPTLFDIRTEYDEFFDGSPTDMFDTEGHSRISDQFSKVGSAVSTMSSSVVPSDVWSFEDTDMNELFLLTTHSQPTLTDHSHIMSSVHSPQTESSMSTSLDGYKTAVDLSSDMIQSTSTEIFQTRTSSPALPVVFTISSISASSVPSKQNETPRNELLPSSSPLSSTGSSFRESMAEVSSSLIGSPSMTLPPSFAYSNNVIPSTGESSLSLTLKDAPSSSYSVVPTRSTDAIQQSLSVSTETLGIEINSPATGSLTSTPVPSYTKPLSIDSSAIILTQKSPSSSMSTVSKYVPSLSGETLSSPRVLSSSSTAAASSSSSFSRLSLNLESSSQFSSARHGDLFTSSLSPESASSHPSIRVSPSSESPYASSTSTSNLSVPPPNSREVSSSQFPPFGSSYDTSIPALNTTSVVIATPKSSLESSAGSFHDSIDSSNNTWGTPTLDPMPSNSHDTSSTVVGIKTSGFDSTTISVDPTTLSSTIISTVNPSSPEVSTTVTQSSQPSHMSVYVSRVVNDGTLKPPSPATMSQHYSTMSAELSPNRISTKATNTESIIQSSGVNHSVSSDLMPSSFMSDIIRTHRLVLMPTSVSSVEQPSLKTPMNASSNTQYTHISSELQPDKEPSLMPSTTLKITDMISTSTAQIWTLMPSRTTTDLLNSVSTVASTNIQVASSTTVTLHDPKDTTSDENVSDYLLKWVFHPEGQDVTSAQFLDKVVKGLETTFEIGYSQNKHTRHKRDATVDASVNVNIQSSKVLPDGSAEVQFTVEKNGQTMKAEDASVVFNQASMDDLDSSTGVKSVEITAVNSNPGSTYTKNMEINESSAEQSSGETQNPSDQQEPMSLESKQNSDSTTLTHSSKEQSTASFFIPNFEASKSVPDILLASQTSLLEPRSLSSSTDGSDPSFFIPNFQVSKSVPNIELASQTALHEPKVLSSSTTVSDSSVFIPDFQASTSLPDIELASQTALPKPKVLSSSIDVSASSNVVPNFLTTVLSSSEQSGQPTTTSEAVSSSLTSSDQSINYSTETTSESVQTTLTPSLSSVHSIPSSTSTNTPTVMQSTPASSVSSEGISPTSSGIESSDVSGVGDHSTLQSSMSSLSVTNYLTSSSELSEYSTLQSSYVTSSIQSSESYSWLQPSMTSFSVTSYLTSSSELSAFGILQSSDMTSSDKLSESYSDLSVSKSSSELSTSAESTKTINSFTMHLTSSSQISLSNVWNSVLSSSIGDVISASVVLSVSAPSSELSQSAESHRTINSFTIGLTASTQDILSNDWTAVLSSSSDVSSASVVTSTDVMSWPNAPAAKDNPFTPQFATSSLSQTLPLGSTSVEGSYLTLVYSPNGQSTKTRTSDLPTTSNYDSSLYPTFVTMGSINTSTSESTLGPTPGMSSPQTVLSLPSVRSANTFSTSGILDASSSDISLASSIRLSPDQAATKVYSSILLATRVLSDSASDVNATSSPDLSMLSVTSVESSKASNFLDLSVFQDLTTSSNPDDSTVTESQPTFRSYDSLLSSMTSFSDSLGDYNAIDLSYVVTFLQTPSIETSPSMKFQSIKSSRTIDSFDDVMESMTLSGSVAISSEASLTSDLSNIASPSFSLVNQEITSRQSISPQSNLYDETSSTRTFAEVQSSEDVPSVTSTVVFQTDGTSTRNPGGEVISTDDSILPSVSSSFVIPNVIATKLLSDIELASKVLSSSEDMIHSSTYTFESSSIGVQGMPQKDLTTPETVESTTPQFITSDSTETTTSEQKNSTTSETFDSTTPQFVTSGSPESTTSEPKNSTTSETFDSTTPQFVTSGSPESTTSEPKNSTTSETTDSTTIETTDPTTPELTESTTPEPPPKESLMLLRMNINLDLNITGDRFTENLRTGLVELYRIAQSVNRRKRSADYILKRFKRQEDNLDVEIVSSERDTENPGQVSTTFAVSEDGGYVDAGEGAAVYNRVTEAQASAILSHEVLEPIRPAYGLTEEDNNLMLIIIIIVIVAVILILLAFFIVSRVRRLRNANAVGDLPPRYQRGETLEDHNLTVDVEKGEIVDKTPTSTPALVPRSVASTERKVPLTGGVSALEDDDDLDEKYTKLSDKPEKLLMEKGSHRTLILKEKELLEKLGVHENSSDVKDLSLELPVKRSNKEKMGGGGPSGYSTVGSECPLISSSASITTVSSIDDDVHTDASDEFTVIIPQSPDSEDKMPIEKELEQSSREKDTSVDDVYRKDDTPMPSDTETVTPNDSSNDNGTPVNEAIIEKQDLGITENPLVIVEDAPKEHETKVKETPSEKDFSGGVKSWADRSLYIPLASVGVQSDNLAVETRSIDTQTSKDSSLSSDSDLSSPEKDMTPVREMPDPHLPTACKMVQTPWVFKRRSDTRDLFIDDDDLKGSASPINTRLSISAGSGETAKFLFPATESLQQAYERALQRSNRSSYQSSPGYNDNTDPQSSHKSKTYDSEDLESVSISSLDSDTENTLSSGRLSLEGDSLEDALLHMGPLQMAGQSEVTTAWSRKSSGSSGGKYPEDPDSSLEYMQMFPSGVLPKPQRDLPQPKPRTLRERRMAPKMKDSIEEDEEEEEEEAIRRKEEATLRARRLLDQSHALGCAPDLHTLSASEMMARIKEELQKSEEPKPECESTPKKHLPETHSSGPGSSSSPEFGAGAQENDELVRLGIVSGSPGGEPDSTTALLERVKGELQRMDSCSELPRAQSRKKGKSPSKS